METKTVFIHLFESKQAPLGLRAGSTVFESHQDADLKSALLSPHLKKTFVSVGKCRFRVKDDYGW